MEIRLLVCGDRNWTDYNLILSTLKEIEFEHGLTLIIHGGCRGADLLAGRAATALQIIQQKFEADWVRYGKAGGPKRNLDMIKRGKPTHVLAFHDGIENSLGTADMLKRAIAHKIPVHIISHQKSKIPHNFFGT